MLEVLVVKAVISLQQVYYWQPMEQYWKSTTPTSASRPAVAAMSWRKSSSWNTLEAYKFPQTKMLSKLNSEKVP